MTPQNFIAKWGIADGVPGPAYGLNEEQGAQSHFLDLCELLGVPKHGSEAKLAQRPAWLAAAHQSLDAAVAAAYGWPDYTPDTPDETLLQRLLALNLARAKA